MATLLPHDHGHSLPIEQVLSSLPDIDQAAKASALFSLLSDASRIRIFWLLCHSEECVTNIAAAVDMSAAAVSHHLKILSMKELIVSHRIGKEIHYALADNENAAFAHRILDDYFRIACPGECGHAHCDHDHH